MNQKQMEELLYQSLEAEIGGGKVYEKALQCVQNDDLRVEWQNYLDQTRRHAEVLRNVCGKLGMDLHLETAGRQVVRFVADSLVRSMDMALQSGQLHNAQIVAAEAVLHAETKDHMNWQLINFLSKEAGEPAASALKDAYDEVEDQEDEHFFHTRGWARELWAEALGIKSVLPPPEEKMDVKTMITAATAEQGRRLM